MTVSMPAAGSVASTDRPASARARYGTPVGVAQPHHHQRTTGGREGSPSGRWCSSSALRCAGLSAGRRHCFTRVEAVARACGRCRGRAASRHGDGCGRTLSSARNLRTMARAAAPSRDARVVSAPPAAKVARLSPSIVQVKVQPVWPGDRGVEQHEAVAGGGGCGDRRHHRRDVPPPWSRCGCSCPCR